MGDLTSQDVFSLIPHGERNNRTRLMEALATEDR